MEFLLWIKQGVSSLVNGGVGVPAPDWQLSRLWKQMVELKLGCECRRLADGVEGLQVGKELHWSGAREIQLVLGGGQS